MIILDSHMDLEQRFSNNTVVRNPDVSTNCQVILHHTSNLMGRDAASIKPTMCVELS